MIDEKDSNQQCENPDCFHRLWVLRYKATKNIYDASIKKSFIYAAQV
jgi:hypothetical protein